MDRTPPSRSNAVTVTVSIDIAATPAAVFELTQDFTRRREWDRNILEARVVAETPQRRVAIRARGGLRCLFAYRLFDRPRRTTLAMEEIVSPVIAAGGGSWSYEPIGAATRFTQVNHLELRPGLLARLLLPLVRWRLRHDTLRALRCVKQLIERR